MVLSGQSLQDQVTEWWGLEELCAAEISLLDLFCNLQGRHSRQPNVCAQGSHLHSHDVTPCHRTR